MGERQEIGSMDTFSRGDGDIHQQAAPLAQQYSEWQGSWKSNKGTAECLANWGGMGQAG